MNADLAEMGALARSIMLRAPDVQVHHRRRLYLNRWHVLRHDPELNETGSNTYIHQFLIGDPEVPHDHPWPNTSVILHGSYVEWTPEGEFTRRVGDIVSRPANALHAIIKMEPSTITWFQTGSKEREWGFQTETGWVHWKEFRGRS